MNAGYGRKRTFSPEFSVGFFGVGAEKAGTTWVASCLDEHPGICMSEPKEINYFNKTFENGARNPRATYPTEWYERRFALSSPGVLIGEFSTSYLSDETASEAICTAFPETKIIICLRHPVERLLSRYTMFSQTRKSEGRSLRKAIEGEWVGYVEYGRYARHVSRYFERFGRDRVMLVFHDDIKDAPVETMRRLYEFLGVDEGFIAPSVEKRINSARTTRSKLAYDAFGWAARGLVSIGLGAFVRKARDIGAANAISRLNSRPFRRAAIDDETRKWLVGLFEEDVVKLERIVERDLSSWKT